MSIGIPRAWYPRDRLGAVVRPVQHAPDVTAWQPRAPPQLPAQQRRGCAHVFFAIFKYSFAAVIAPTAFADVACDRFLVDLLPTLDAVGATGVRQTLARPLTHFIRIMGEQDVARRQVGCVLIEDVPGELPTERHEAGHLSPRGIGDEQRVGADVKRRRVAEVSAP
jgi:hypothetical protein